MILEMYLTNQTIKKVAHFDLKKKNDMHFQKVKGCLVYVFKYMFQFLNTITYFFTFFLLTLFKKKIKNYYLKTHTK